MGKILKYLFQSDNASPEKVTQSAEIMIHHSRNTAQKQWAETKVLTISGVVRVFNTKRKLLRSMDDYSKAWLLLLEYVEKMALSDTTEVSLAALKSMQEMIVSSGEEAALPQRDASLKDINWAICWKAWLNIGSQKTKFISNAFDVATAQGNLLLTGYIQIFASLFPRLKAGSGQQQQLFGPRDVDSLGDVLVACVQVPIEHDMESREALTQVHAAALQAVGIVEEEALSGRSPRLTPAVFEVLFKFLAKAFSKHQQADANAASNGSQSSNGSSSGANRFREKLSLFGEASAERLGAFFLAAHHQALPETEEAKRSPDLSLPHVLYKTVEVLRTPLRLKYRCFRDSDWRTSVNVLLKILRAGIPIARRNNGGKDYDPFWSELAATLEHFLFPESAADQRQEERMADEALDCHIIELLREEVLPYPESVPPAFIRKMVVLLNKGSIHSTIQLNDDCSGSVGLREDLAKQCFETLLDFSMLRRAEAAAAASGAASGGGDDQQQQQLEASEAATNTFLTNRLAITSLLQRFKVGQTVFPIYARKKYMQTG